MANTNNIGFWSKIGYYEMLFFFVQGISLGMWIVRIPDLQTDHNLDKAELATILLGFGLGSIVVIIASTWMFSHMSIKKVWVISHLLLCLCFAVIGYAPNPLLLFLGIAWLGATELLAQLAMNVQVNCVERDEKVFVMSRCHALLMVGLIIGSLLGVIATSIGMSVGLSLLISAIISLPSGLIAILQSKDRKADESKKRSLSLPSKGFFAIGLFLIGNTFCEGVIGSWSTIYVLETLDEPSALAGLGFTLFIATLALGRIVGDHLKSKYGAVKIARWFCAIAISSSLLMIWAPNAFVLVLGFALCGFGISLAFPYAMSAAAELKGDATIHATWIMLCAMAGFQFGPVVVGFIAEATSLSIAFVILLPLFVISLWVTSCLAKTDNE